MNSYGEIIPLYVQHNDIQWDAFELANHNYPIQNKHWELQDSGFLLLKETSPFDYDYDPWNRKMRAWQFLDTDGFIIECKDWTTQLTSNIASSLYEIRYTTIEGKCIPLWRYTDESNYT